MDMVVSSVVRGFQIPNRDSYMFDYKDEVDPPLSICIKASTHILKQANHFLCLFPLLIFLWVNFLLSYF